MRVGLEIFVKLAMRRAAEFLPSEKSEGSALLATHWTTHAGFTTWAVLVLPVTIIPSQVLQATFF